MQHERRHAGERRSGEAQLRAILDGALDAVVGMDARGRITFWNPQAERLFGWTRDEAMGRLLSETIVPPSLREAHGRGLEHYLATGEGLLLGRVVEVMALRRDGREIPVELAVTVVKKAGHHTFTAFIRDVSERKKGEENSRLLVETSHNLELLSTLSHELRTPLTAIVGWAYLLRMGGLDEATARRALDTIERNAKAQAQKISDILDVSKIATGKLRLNLRAMDLPVAIVAAVDAAMPAANAKGIRVQTVLDPGAGPVWGDPDRLQQVVWNLLSNAVKFTPNGGSIHVRLARRDSHAAITVEDTGTGIRADFLPHVFERFRQGDETSTRAHGGMGLGLAVVRYLVEMHGGSVTVTSPGTGKGAAFTVTLPLATAGVREGMGAPPQALADSPDLEAAFADAPRLNGVRVLVCARDPDDREAMGGILKRSGAEVEAVGSPEEALRSMAQNPAQVLLSEVDVPGGDGYALLKEVRTLPPERGGRVPAAAVMAYARSEDRIRALREGFQLYVSKPVHPAELITVVASLAERPPAAAE
jgi:PAS domain S-box-containing protein